MKTLEDLLDAMNYLSVTLEENIEEFELWVDEVCYHAHYI